MVIIKMIALILSLGIDTLIIASSLGMVKTKGKLKIAVVFAAVEALMPLIGLLIGQGAGQLVGNWASLIGGIALICVAVWLIFFEDEDEEEEKLERNLVGWTLLITALSIGLDELAVGFSIGLIGVPIVITIILIGLQAFIFTFLGLTYGAKLKPFLGEWSEKIAGIVLGLLGIWMLFEYHPN
jgi:putative Mn2+ efflux pump MntP